MFLYAIITIQHFLYWANSFSILVGVPLYLTVSLKTYTYKKSRLRDV